MTACPHDLLEAHYRRVEAGYSVVTNVDYAQLVTANGNSKAPIHRWFKMKEAYSNRLPEKVLDDIGLKDDHLTIVDPFSGSGTTAVAIGDLLRSGRLRSAKVRAMEVNPFLHLVSSAKLLGHADSLEQFQKIAGRVARRALETKDGVAPTPALSTFGNSDYFPVANLAALLALKASINAGAEAGDFSDDEQRLLKLALAAAVEPASNLRRDGRALRLAEGKACEHPVDVFLDVCAQVVQDSSATSGDFDACITLADARAATFDVDGVADLALFSPPYPNNIDYTEVYKLEGWMLDAYSDADAFSAQRRRTIRSHCSLRWGDAYAFEQTGHDAEMRQLLEPILNAVPSDRYRNGREEVILGYADDMFSALTSTASAIRPGGYMAIVVGNSMHGKSDHDYVIASDLILARIAEYAGLAIEKIVIARYPRRRVARSAFLRESVVLAKKVGSA